MSNKTNKIKHDYLKAYPLCAKCLSKNPTVYKKSTHIGLIFPDEDKSEKDNWIALCDECFNNQKLY